MAKPRSGPLPFAGDVSAGFIVQALEQRTLLSAGLIKDINLQGAGSQPSQFTAANGELYFDANDGPDGIELWKSDGTQVGTTLVKDIAQGEASSYPQDLIDVNGTLFFAATDGNGTELWKSDGTAAGTVMVKDVVPDFASPNPEDIIDANGTLYFTVTAGTMGTELWKSDGSATGTVLITTVNSGMYVSSPSDTYLTDLNGTLYFVATDSRYGTSLWKSDGTSTGTIRVVSGAASNLFAFNGDLYFAMNNALWQYNGVAAAMLRSGTGATLYAPADLTQVNGTLFLQANDGSHGAELWKTDGTTAGTALVSDIFPGPNGSAPSDLTNVDGTLFFSANDGPHGTELWKSDGTSSGTMLVKDIYAGPSSSSPAWLANLNGEVLFSAEYPGLGVELWESDGTSAGTFLLNDINPANSGSDPSYLTAFGGKVFFQADDGAHGAELWVSDGTSAGTMLLGDLNLGTGNSLQGPQPADGSLSAVADGEMYFAAIDGPHGDELWKTDGTSSGTMLVDDITPGIGSSVPTNFTAYNGEVYFNYYQNLYKTDGTAAGTVIVQGSNSGLVPGPASQMAVFDGDLYFTANGGSPDGAQLWKTDGTVAGTVIVKTISSSESFGSEDAEDQLVVSGAYLYFADGVGLWKSDGTTSGTILLRDFDENLGYGSPQNLCDVNGTLFFTASDGTDANELWKTDGTTTGTLLVENTPLPNDEVATPEGLTDLNGLLLFGNYDPTNGYTLWRSDGTSAGTYMVSATAPAITATWLAAPTVFDGKLFYAAGGLWETDGTSAGTFQINYGRGGVNGAYVNSLAVMNNSLYFSGSIGSDDVDPQMAYSLWKTDGTQAGTELADPTEFTSGWGGSTFLGVVNGEAIFEGTDFAHGTEPWALPLPSDIVSLSALGPNPANFDQSLDFEAVVSGGVPDGEAVTLEDASNDNAVVATGTLSAGSATLIVPAATLAVGTHSLIALYGGDENFAPSQSAVYEQTVDPDVLPSYISASSGAVYSYNAATGALSLTSGTLKFTADNTIAPVVSLTAFGSSSHVIFQTSEHLEDLSLSGGAQAVVQSVGETRTHSDHNVLVIGTLGSSSDPVFSVDSSSKLDLQDNDLIVHSGSSDAAGASEYASLAALATDGRNPASKAPGQPDGQWNGYGLSSSAAAAANAAAGYEQIGLAVVVNSTLLTGAFSSWQVGSFNEPLGSNDVIVKYDYLGDYALEGEVSADDAGILQLEYDNGATTGHTWATGCSLDDGLSDNTEAGLFQLQYGLGTGGNEGQPL